MADIVNFKEASGKLRQAYAQSKGGPVTFGAGYVAGAIKPGTTTRVEKYPAPRQDEGSYADLPSDCNP